MIIFSWLPFSLFCIITESLDVFESTGKKFPIYCEAQGKGRAKGRPRKVTQRSFMDCGWWMVDILSLMLYIKFGCVTFPPPPEVS